MNGRQIAWVAGASVAAAGIAFAVSRLSSRPRAPRRALPQRCAYGTYAWNTRLGRSVDRRRIDKAYAQVAGDERSPDDPRCTICEGDQVELHLPGVEPFRVCWVYAEAIHRALTRAIDRGAIIDKVTAYRPGRTGGPLDSEGRRTRFGGHAYGMAIDVNAEQNGMYSGGRLRHGGPYRPERGDPRTITHASPIYTELRRAGLQWAGDRVDELGYADWMHFVHPGRR